MTQPLILTMEGVDFGYPDREPLFRDFNLAIGQGGFYLVKGPSGRGKSTLLRLLVRMEEPIAGGIFFKGRPLTDYSPPKLRRSVLHVRQTPVLMDGTVRANLLQAFQFKSNQDLTPPADDRLLELMTQMRLHGVSLDDAAVKLSVGQQQRLCLIRGALLSPEVLLLDEPTSALDPESAAVVEEFAVDANLDGLTVVMISHRDFTPNRIQPEMIDLGKD